MPVTANVVRPKIQSDESHEITKKMNLSISENESLTIITLSIIVVEVLAIKNNH